MRILLIHNFHQHPGGENVVLESEAALLTEHGNRVIMYTEDNKRIPELSRPHLAARAVWSQESYRAVREIARENKPDVAHVHNTLPLISPAVYYALRAERVPVVQTLHNYGLDCLSNNLFRDGRVCEDCLGRAIPWPGVAHACYREDRLASAVVATRLMTHRALGTYRKAVDVYIVLTEFARQKLGQGGLQGEKVVVKPNFVHPDPGLADGSGSHALFVGRLSREKGVPTLLEAWWQLDDSIPLVIVGDGPLSADVQRISREIGSIRFVGRQCRSAVFNLMRAARILVVPSECYEGFPLVVVEAFAHGLPVIASDLGALASVVAHDRTGLRFRPGDPRDLAQKIASVFFQPTTLEEMRRAARAEFESKYTAERNYENLMAIYELALETKKTSIPQCR